MVRITYEDLLKIAKTGSDEKFFAECEDVDIEAVYGDAKEILKMINHNAKVAFSTPEEMGKRTKIIRREDIFG